MNDVSDGHVKAVPNWQFGSSSSGMLLHHAWLRPSAAAPCRGQGEGCGRARQPGGGHCQPGGGARARAQRGARGGTGGGVHLQVSDCTCAPVCWGTRHSCGGLSCPPVPPASRERVIQPAGFDTPMAHWLNVGTMYCGAWVLQVLQGGAERGREAVAGGRARRLAAALLRHAGGSAHARHGWVLRPGWGWGLNIIISS